MQHPIRPKCQTDEGCRYKIHVVSKFFNLEPDLEAKMYFICQYYQLLLIIVKVIFGDQTIQIFNNLASAYSGGEGLQNWPFLFLAEFDKKG